MPAPPHDQLLPDRPRLLVVDDDPHTLVSLQALLEPLGADVHTAASGEDALAQLDRFDFAALLLDVGLPRLDGFQVAQAVKARPLHRHLPVIFLTGHIDEAELRRGYELGAADYLFKPIDPDVLRAKVNVFVELDRLRAETAILTHRALHDPLTGLPNRTLFLDRLEQALAGLDREPSRVTVLFLDLDGFKEINDKHGHDAGDRMLIETARHLQSAIRATDTAARFGGDEFLILCEQPPATDIDRLVARIQGRLEQPSEPDGVTVTATIGHASTNSSAGSSEQLIRAADRAMLAAKTERAAPSPAATT